MRSDDAWMEYLGWLDSCFVVHLIFLLAYYEYEDIVRRDRHAARERRTVMELKLAAENGVV